MSHNAERGAELRSREIAALASNDRRIAALFGQERTLESGDGIVGTVMIKCPDTGRDIATGIIADRESFNATPVFFARVYCPACRTEHEWFAKEAWVCEADAPDMPPHRQLS